MVNLFTGAVVSGGWPVDWWANHPSPFPLMTAVEIEYVLVPEMAVFHDRQGRGDPLVVMFRKLKDQYGWSMFRKAFRTAIEDGINWDSFGHSLRACEQRTYRPTCNWCAEDIGGILRRRFPATIPPW